MRLLLLLPCILVGCLPTKSQVVQCNTDPECGPGWRCEMQSHVCVCSGASVPGCQGFLDALPAAADASADAIVAWTSDATIAPTDAWADAASGTAVDAAADAVAADVAVDVASPPCKVNGDCQGGRPVCLGGVCVECADAGDCKDPARGFCVGNVCVGCDQAGATACSGTTSVCAPAGTADAGGQCVQCLTSAGCSGATPICTNNTCTACTASSQCAARSSTTPACAVSGANTGLCVQCAANTDCGGTTPVCDTTTNKCVQCLTSAGCSGATPICTNNACAACTTANQCAGKSPTAPACATSGTSAGQCVACTENSTCSGTAPVCDTTTNKCVQCVTSASCPAGTPICTNNTCTACTAASQCAAKSPTAPACATSGTSAGQCVACTDNNTCSGTTPVCDTTTNKCVQCTDNSTCSGTTPICASNVCTACNKAAQCAAKSPTAPACATSGACVQCTDNSTCSGATPFCDTTTNKCVACLNSAGCSGTTPICTNQVCTACTSSSLCAAKSPTAPACASGGACVQCTDNSTCSGTTPICATSTNTCRGCTADSECADIGPGVCMAHQDSRCASAAETIVVVAGGSLPTVTSLSDKKLVVIRGTVSGSLAWTLAGLPQMTIVGQTAGILSGIGSTATVHVTGGDLYIRNLSLTGGSPGLWADGGGIVRLDHVSVSNNTAGGILLDGAGFDIKNTTVNNNGANTAGAAAFGGIRVQSSLTTPKVLALSTIVGNQLLGVTCDASTSLSPSPTTVLVSGTTGVDIASVCGFNSCITASTTCGAQP